MQAWKLLSLTFCALSVVCVSQALAEDSSRDLTKSDEEPSSGISQSSAEGEVGVDANGRNQSEPEGPPDSHEAMNNRELKPKMTIGTRRKRNYEFLMGLVKRNSTLYQITKKDDDSTQSSASQASASEQLLELLVKIAENPKQWSRIHELLQKVDADLMKSKELVNNARADAGEARSKVDEMKYAWLPSPVQTASSSSTSAETATTSPKPNRLASAYQHFAYHRVTGNPLSFGGGGSKCPKAYIAVSVIAPKPIQERASQAISGKTMPDAASKGLADELALENELKELKPWTHQQNLNNMAAIRSQWIIQNDQNSLYER